MTWKGCARIAKARRGDWQASRAMGQNHAMTAAIVLGIASAAFLGGGLVLTQFGLRIIHPLSGAAISVPSFTICLHPAVADPAARRDHRLARGADLRRRGPGVSRRADDAHLRVQPRARPGGHRRARQSVAAALGRGRGRCCCTSRCAPLQFAGLVVAVLGRAGHHRHAHRRTCATGAPGRCCCRSARR